MQLSSYTQDALIDLGQVLEQHGVQAALAFLNARVPHRLTTVNHIDDGHMVCTLLHDKAGKLTPGTVAKVPMDHSFCQFVVRDGSFYSAHSGNDIRLIDHPYPGVMLSYCGVPLIDANGELFGTLCHLDMESHTLPPEEFDVFQRAARLFPKYVKRR